jgi:peptidoglycan/LPS O-acetylase OafA/YrhL
LELYLAESSVELRPGELGAAIQHRLPALRALTSLRFFAAMQVVCHHLSLDHKFTTVPLLGRFFTSGYTGVSLFFVLSGFILAYNYPEVKDRREFWISRFARVYPMYLLALLLAFAYSFSPAAPQPHPLWARLGVSAALLQTWYRPFEDSFNGPGWTLSVEAFFYATFPFVLAWTGRLTRRMFAVCCVAYVSLLCGPVMAHALYPASKAPFSAAFLLTQGTLPLFHWPVFLMGVYLGQSFLKKKEDQVWWPVVLGAVGSVMLLCVAPTALYGPIRRGLLVMTYAALIYGLASVRRGWLTNRWIVLAGEISFSLYILQIPVIRSVLGVTRRIGLGFYASSGVVLVVLIGVAYLGYRYVELPGRIAIRGWLGRRPVLEKI